MKRLMFLVVLLMLFLVIPLTARAAPPAAAGTETPTPAAESTATPLPEDTGTTSTETTDALSQALGTLAVYAAIIAALAAGTEVVTDLLRPFFGLERQPQAMEAFEQMKEWLPQTMKEMGADPQAQAQLQGYLNDLDSTVKEFEGYASGEKIAEVVQKWALGAIKSGGAQLDARLKELEARLKEELKLKPEDIEKVLNRARGILKMLGSGEELLEKLRKLLEDLNLQPAQIESAVGKALEMMNTLVEDEQLKQQLKTLLAGLGVPPDKIDVAVEQASELLKSLKGATGVQGVIKLASSLDSYGNLLEAVEGQRGAASYLRRLWRAVRDWKGFFRLTSLIPVTQENQAKIGELDTKKANGQRIWFESIQRWWFGADRWKELRGRSLLGALFYCLEQGWNTVRDWLFSSVESTESLSTLLTPENATKAILTLDRQHYLTEARRQRLLRFTTVFIGIALAITLRIDSLELLKPLFPEGLPLALFEGGEFKTLDLILAKLLRLTTPWDVENWAGLGKWLLAWIAVATPGMLLSGLAASAGSSFWHDQLDRLRATKKVSEQVKSVVGQMKGTQENQT